MRGFGHSLSLLPALLALVSTIAAFEQSPTARRQHHANLARQVVQEEGTEVLTKRSNSGRGTFYEINQGDRGACGDLLHENDFFVALNKPQYGDLNAKSDKCGKQLTIHYGGNSATAVVLDACPECAFGALDLSPSLFKHFASEDKGVIDLTWSFVDEEKAAADIAAKKKAEEEAINRKKKEIEDALNKKKAEQEAAINKKKAEDEAARNRQKAEEELAAKKKAEDDKRKAEEDKRRASAAKEAADDKRKADEAKKAADSEKAAKDKEAARQKAIDEQKQRDAAAAKEESSKKQNQPPPTKQDKKGESKAQIGAHKETMNIKSFNEVLQGMDKMVLDGHAHRGR